MQKFAMMLLFCGVSMIVTVQAKPSPCYDGECDYYEARDLGGGNEDDYEDRYRSDSEGRSNLGSDRVGNGDDYDSDTGGIPESGNRIGNEDNYRSDSVVGNVDAYGGGYPSDNGGVNENGEGSDYEDNYRSDSVGRFSYGGGYGGVNRGGKRGGNGGGGRGGGNRNKVTYQNFSIKREGNRITTTFDFK